MALSDALAPIYVALVELGVGLRTWSPGPRICGTSGRKTRPSAAAENEQLRLRQSIALALDAENQRLKANLHWIPDPAPSYVTARVVADAGGVYAEGGAAPDRAKNTSVRVWARWGAGRMRGLVGRGHRGGGGGMHRGGPAHQCDLNSRIPAIHLSSHAHAILAGTNGPRPRLPDWPEGSAPSDEGEQG